MSLSANNLIKYIQDHCVKCHPIVESGMFGVVLRTVQVWSVLSTKSDDLLCPWTI